MNKTRLTKVAKTLMFEVNPTVLKELSVEYDFLSKKIQALKKIDVTGIKPMIYVDESPITILRPDKIEQKLSQSSFIKNAPVIKNNFIVLPKVIQDVE